MKLSINTIQLLAAYDEFAAYMCEWFSENPDGQFWTYGGKLEGGWPIL